MKKIDHLIASNIKNKYQIELDIYVPRIPLIEHYEYKMYIQSKSNNQV